MLNRRLRRQREGDMNSGRQSLGPLNPEELLTSTGLPAEVKVCLRLGGADVSLTIKWFSSR